MYNNINLKPLYLDKNDLRELNTVTDDLIEYLATNKWINRIYSFNFSALKHEYTTKETQQDHKLLCEIPTSFDPVLTMKDYKNRHFLGIKAMQTDKLCVWHLEKGYTISELQSNKNIRQIVFNEILYHLKTTDDIIDEDVIEKHVDRFRNAYADKYQLESVIELDSYDSLIAYKYQYKGVYIKSIDELYNYILSKPETYRQIHEETKLFLTNPLVFLYHQIGETAYYMTNTKLSGTRENEIASIQTFLKSSTINHILASKYRNNFISFVKNPYFDLSNIAIMLDFNTMLNSTLEFDKDWLRFIDLFKLAGLNFELIDVDSVRTQIKHCNRILGLYKNSSISEDRIIKPQIVYNAYDFVKLVKDLEALNATFDMKQADNVVINRFAKGYDFSEEQLDIFENYHIRYFISAPLTVYRMKKELARLECLMQLVER